MSVVTTTDVLPGTTRVWIYQSNRPFRDADLHAIREEVRQFVQSWISHNRALKAYGEVYHNRFIVLMVDESQAEASGCSIDKSVYFLKSLQQRYEVDLFDRMVFSYLEGEEVRSVDRNAFQELYRRGEINDDTPVFDTLVENKAQFDATFVKPLGKSWHKRMV